MASSWEQQQETVAAAKRRVAHPTKKARNVAAADREPEFLGEPVAADEACAKWPQRYQRDSPKWCDPDLISDDLYFCVMEQLLTELPCAPLVLRTES
ncbi:hypothetical protein ZWY2020_052124 [Hordeum vulgare]|nr:hypothetical protein ZWY2020_052124 [Hordeum vulgare]